MLASLLFVSAVAVLSIYSMSHLLRENRRLRDKVADHVFRESVNRDTAQGILDDLRAREGEVLELTEDMRICDRERAAQESLICEQSQLLESNVLPIRADRGVWY